MIWGRLAFICKPGYLATEAITHHSSTLHGSVWFGFNLVRQISNASASTFLQL